MTKNDNSGIPGKSYLTKYETSKVVEGLCPKCPAEAPGELQQSADDGSMLECPKCGDYFVVDYIDDSNLN